MATIGNIFIDAGASYAVVFEYTDAESNPIDLTGYTAKLQIRDFPSSPTVVFESEPSITASTGTITFSMNPTQTSALIKSKYVYALELTLNNNVIRLIEGEVFVSPEVVR